MSRPLANDYAALSEMLDATLEMRQRTTMPGDRREWLRVAIDLDREMSAALPPGVRVGCGHAEAGRVCSECGW